MLINELGAATTIIIGLSLGFVGFAILIFWLQLFFKNFDSKSKIFWPLFWVHMLVWIIGVCIIPADLLNDSFSSWAWPFMIYFFGSLVVMAITKIIGKR